MYNELNEKLDIAVDMAHYINIRVKILKTNLTVHIHAIFNVHHPATSLFQGHPSNFKVTQLKKIVDFDPNWAFPDCNSSSNSPMTMK